MGTKSTNFIARVPTRYATIRTQNFIVASADGTFLALDTRFADTSPSHLFAIVAYRAEG